MLPSCGPVRALGSSVGMPAQVPLSRHRKSGCRAVTLPPGQVRSAEEWERCICENKAFAILNRMQAGRSALIKNDGGEMLVAIVLDSDKPLAAAEALVDDPPALVAEIMQIMKDKQSHPVIAQMVHPDVRDDFPPRVCNSLIIQWWQPHTKINPTQ